MTPHGLAEGEQPQFDKPQQRPEMVRRVEAILLASGLLLRADIEEIGKLAAEIAEAVA